MNTQLAETGRSFIETIGLSETSLVWLNYRISVKKNVFPLEFEWLDSFRRPLSYFNWTPEGFRDDVRNVNGVEEHQTCSVMSLKHEWWDDEWCTNPHPAVCQLKRSLQTPVTPGMATTTRNAIKCTSDVKSHFDLFLIASTTLFMLTIRLYNIIY